MMRDPKRASILGISMLFVLALLIAPVAADRMVLEEGTDHDGNDYQTLFPGTSMYTGTAPGCAGASLNDAACNTCTFNPRDQSCWLKQVVPPATKKSHPGLKWLSQSPVVQECLLHGRSDPFFSQFFDPDFT